MNLKLTGELFVMKMKKHEKLEEKLTWYLKIDVKTLIRFDPSTQKSQKFALYWAAFHQSM